MTRTEMKTARIETGLTTKVWETETKCRIYFSEDRVQIGYIALDYSDVSGYNCGETKGIAWSAAKPKFAGCMMTLAEKYAAAIEAMAVVEVPEIVEVPEVKEEKTLLDEVAEVFADNPEIVAAVEVYAEKCSKRVRGFCLPRNRKEAFSTIQVFLDSEGKDDLCDIVTDYIIDEII